MNDKTLRMRLKASALAVALAALPIGAHAAGFGKITVLSALGQPLRAEIDISANRDELSSLSARVASTDAFRQAGVDFAPGLVNVRFSVEKRPNGQAYLLMKSEQPFNDPFLDLLVEMRWASGRMMREYTFLLDPPDLNKPAQQVPQVNVPEARTTVTQAATAATLPPAQAEPKSAATEENKKRETMRVVRGADGVQRIVKAEKPTPSAAPEGSTRTVKRGDTLHRIATETRPEGVNLDQMLIALFRTNKDAFDGNIHRLKAGKILTIPDQEAAAAISPAEAGKEIHAQSADFNAYRRKLAAATAGAEAQKEEAPKQASSGKIAPKVDDKAPAVAAGKDKLEISKTEVAKGGVGATGKAAAKVSEEEALAREKALKEAQSRISELEKNLSDLKKLGELKSQSMADLQKQAQAGKPAAVAPTDPVAPSSAAKPAAPTPAAAPAAPATPAATPEPATAAAPTPAATPEAPAAAGTESAPAVTPPTATPAPAKPATKKAAPPPPPPPPPPSFVDDNPELVYGGGGALALLLGYLGFSAWSRKRKQAAESAFDANGPISESSVAVNSVFGSTGGQVVDTGHSVSDAHNSLQTDFSLPGMDKADTTDGVDPIKEADVYMAYGRNAQAEEILLDALKTDPQRHEIHAKLLEIYASRKSIKQFESIASDLQQQTGGSGPHWEQAALLGQQLDPANPLYGGRPAAAQAPAEPAFNPEATIVVFPDQQPAAAPVAMEQTMVMEAEAQEELPESLDFELDLDLGGNNTPAADQEIAASGEATEAASPTAATDLDFDLGASDDDVASSASTTTGDSNDIDFNLDSGFVTAPASPETTAAPSDSDESGIIDFDLGLDSSAETSPDATANALELTNEIAAETSAQPAAGLDVDFDLDLPDLGPSDAEEAAPAAQTDLAQPSAPSVDLSSISLDLDELPSLDAAPATEATTSPAAGALDADSLMDFDLDAPAPAEASLDSEPAAAAQEDNPEVTTKLELAQAYEEMGDKEGARELLQEVLNEGSAAQQEIARAKLEQIG